MNFIYVIYAGKYSVVQVVKIVDEMLLTLV